MDPKNPAAKTSAAALAAADLIAAVEDAYRAPAPAATSYRDPRPTPAIGDAPPVAQPGRPPMSQKATDASAVMLAAGGGTLMAGTGTGIVLWALAGVDPLTLGLAGGSAVAAAVALARLVRSAGQAAAQAAPVTHHHTYTGPVTQSHRSTSHTQARGMFARSTTDARH